MINRISLSAILWFFGLSAVVLAVGPVQESDKPKQQPEKNFGSVADQAEWLKSPPVPEWTQKKRFTEAGVEQLVAGTAPFLSPAEAEAELDRAMLLIARQWIGERFAPEAAEHLELSPQIIRSQWMTNHLEIPCVFQVPDSGAESMYRSFAQLAMTDKVIGQVSQMWETKQVALREERQRGKLIQWSIGGGALLCLLASVHSYLRVDYLTRGYQTARLRLLLAGTSAAIIGLSLWLFNVVK